MNDFPKIPRVSIGRDEDVSVHLNSSVKAAKPFGERPSDKDSLILRILKEDGMARGHALNYPDDDSDSESELDTKFNEFRLRKQMLDQNYDNDFSDVETHVESDQNEKDTENSQEKNDFHSAVNDHSSLGFEGSTTGSINNPTDANSLKTIIETGRKNSYGIMNTRSLQYIFFGSISFISVLILFLFWKVTALGVFNGSLKPIENYYEINSKFGKIDYSLERFSKLIENISQNQKESVKHGTVLFKELTEEINILTQRLDYMSKEFVGANNLEKLYNDVSSLKVTASQKYLNTSIPSGSFQGELPSPGHINATIEKIKHSVLKDLIAILPEHVPVYIKNNKIHYMPEFHKYIYNFVDSYSKEKNLSLSTTNDYLPKIGETDIKRYVKEAVNSKLVNSINKTDMERLLNDKLNQNNLMLQDKFNNLVDSIHLSGNFSSSEHSLNFENSMKGLFLSSFLDIISKASYKVNFADFALGARILGFLTTTAISTSYDRSLSRRLVFGWYDFLTSNGQDSGGNWKNNANHILVDDNNSWSCSAPNCSVGIRLSSPVIITSLVLDMVPSNPQKQTRLAIYMKPSNHKDPKKLIEYLNTLKFSHTRDSNNKYLKKFHKVKEAIIHTGSKINFLELPASLINLRIPVKDIYIEFASEEGHVELKNVKAYGISEFNSYKYSSQFEELASASIKASHIDYEGEGDILGEDTVFFEY